MLLSQAFKNNHGYQIQVDRLHPIYTYEMLRSNRNHYDNNGYDCYMTINKPIKTAIQTGQGYAHNPKGDYMSGQGVDPVSIAKTLAMLKQGAESVVKAYSGETGTFIKNTYGKFMNEKNPNWRPGFVGEKHMVNKHGLTYNYLGPGTALSQRLERGDPPLDGASGLDAAAKIHDIEYSKAQNFSDVRAADKKFIENVEQSTAGPLSKKFIKGLFKAKMVSEDFGVLKPTAFAKFPNVQDDVPPVIEDKQGSEDISGKGILRHPTDPARKLRNKMRRHRNKANVDKIMNIAFKSIKKRIKKRKKKN